MVKYDAAVIYDFADRLYRKARWIAVQYGAAGAGLGLVATVLLSMLKGSFSIPIGAEPLVLMFVGGLIGVARGVDKGFHLRLEAQKALCQVAIEANTRPRAPAQPQPHQAA